MKIALAQLNYHIGNFESNTQKIIDTIGKAAMQGAELVVFAELSIGGYPAQDFLEFEDFIDCCEQSLQFIADTCQDAACIIGAPIRNKGEKGKPLFNAAVFCFKGKMQFFRKSLLPNYDVFDEYRYFEPAKTFEILHFKGKKIALTICEDIWDVGNSRLYTINPMEELIDHQPDLMINIAASPFNYNQANRRLEVLRANVERYNLPLIYVNQVGAQTELLFDGGSLFFAADGHVVEHLPFFEEALSVVETNTFEQQKSNKRSPFITGKIELIHDALVMGIRDYFKKLGFKQAILGLSGGIDSAVTMALASKALGPENVFGLLMPSQFSSHHSVEDAIELAKNLGSPYNIIKIKDLFDQFDYNLKPVFKSKPFDLTEENIQARIRGVLLMAMSNKFGYILLNTSNKSEAAVGYGTLYGDMNGGLSVLGDVYKTDVFLLAHYINREKEIIPESTIIKPPSAELRPDQKDSDSLPEYDILDQILYQYIELRKGPKELISMGFNEKMVNRILKMVNTTEYKRKQTPPILRISPKAFGMGRRMPIVAKYLS
ncbi:MAG: NAD+ synthase [Bacteroidetes bacterium HGW-Bacteroidetes-1]|nr:MAG: NAD+ synthase [Bacteroidetes bacterium HGW-Bacteroidetes-1]